MSDEKMPIESQKDLLFSKLLPAINNNPFSTIYAQNHAEEIEQKKQQIAEMEAQRELVSEIEIPEGDDLLENLHSRIFARQGVDTQKNYATVNIVEGAVLKNIDMVIARFNSCSCDRCKCDIAAQALSNLPAKYVVTSPENMQKYEEMVDNKEVMNALVTAVLRVRTKPRH